MAQRAPLPLTPTKQSEVVMNWPADAPPTALLSQNNPSEALESPPLSSLIYFPLSLSLPRSPTCPRAERASTASWRNCKWSAACVAPEFIYGPTATPRTSTFIFIPLSFILLLLLLLWWRREAEGWREERRGGVRKSTRVWPGLLGMTGGELR